MAKDRRKFGNDTFTLHVICKTKGQALDEQYYLQRDGYKARLIKKRQKHKNVKYGRIMYHVYKGPKRNRKIIAGI